jgi:hypothetical protein
VVEGENRYNVPILKKPFSEWPIEGPDPIADITIWATRSAERRRAEVPVLGKAKRPANAYILYRKAYSATARMLLGSDLSEIGPAFGQSWSMESKVVQAKFFSLADMNKFLHNQAFPDYIYPSSARGSKD